MNALNELEQDIITELLNIAIGRSARALSELVDQPIELSVPSIEFITRSDAVSRIDRHTSGEGCAVREEFGGPFDGQMLLIFPEQQSLELVKQMVGQDVDLDTITELEQDALIEVGNIILTSCLSSLADAFSIKISNELPSIIKGGGSEIISSVTDDENCFIMFLHVEFHLSQNNISGNIVVMLDMDAVEKLKKNLANYLKNIGSD